MCPNCSHPPVCNCSSAGALGRRRAPLTLPLGRQPPAPSPAAGCAGKGELRNWLHVLLLGCLAVLPRRCQCPVQPQPHLSQPLPRFNLPHFINLLPQHTDMRPYSVDVYLNVTGGGCAGLGCRVPGCPGAVGQPGGPAGPQWAGLARLGGPTCCTCLEWRPVAWRRATSPGRAPAMHDRQGGCSTAAVLAARRRPGNE